jgi:hypothetical protein
MLQKVGMYQFDASFERRAMLEFICPACGEFSLEEAACASCSSGRTSDAGVVAVAE